MISSASEPADRIAFRKLQSAARRWGAWYLDNGPSLSGNVDVALQSAALEYAHAVEDAAAARSTKRKAARRKP